MQNNKLHILSTRPLNSSLIDEAAKNNVLIDVISFIEIKNIISEEAIQTVKNIALKNSVVVFTSMNAVEIVAKQLPNKPDWKIYCIGNTTRKLVEEKFGSTLIIETANYGEELADKIIKNEEKEVVFFCGNIRGDELPQKLRAAKINVEEIAIYQTIQTPHLIDKAYNAILFYSPSAVNSFFSVNKSGNNTKYFAIGKTTAKALQQYTNENIITAEINDKEEMVKMAIEYFSKQKIN